MVLWGHGAQLCSFRLGDSDVVMVSWLLGWVSWSLDRVGHPRWFTHMPNRWRWPSARTSAGAGDHRKPCDPSMWLECLTVCHLGSKSKHSKMPWGELQRFFPNLENHTTLLPPQFTCQNWVTGPALWLDSEGGDYLLYKGMNTGHVAHGEGRGASVDTSYNTSRNHHTQLGEELRMILYLISMRLLQVMLTCVSNLTNWYVANYFSQSPRWIPFLLNFLLWPWIGENGAKYVI